MLYLTSTVASECDEGNGILANEYKSVKGCSPTNKQALQIPQHQWLDQLT